jgi:mitogen-activated protein kinase kinase kinase
MGSNYDFSFVGLTRILCATYESCIDYSIQSSKVKQLMKRLEETGHFLVFTRTYEKYGIYTIADPSLMNDPVKIKELISGYCRPQERLEEIDSPSYVFIFCIQEPLVWEGEIFNVEVPYSEIDIRPGRLRLVSEGDSTELKKTRETVSKLMEGSDILVAVEARCAIPRVNHEFSRIRRLFYRLSVSVLNGVTSMRYKLKSHECRETVNSLFVFAREFSQRGISVMDSSKRGGIAIKLINLCIEWVSFINDDCAPSDYKAFRWTVVAMEFAMVMTRGVNILAISDDQFSKLRAKVADCVTLLISHFDIMGARSKAAEQRLLSRGLSDKRFGNVDINNDDEELFALVREGTLAKLTEIDKKRETMVGGKVLDDTNTDSDFLNFVANSFSNVTIRWQQGRFIGAGAFGSVYASVNLDTGGVMAVKEIRLQDTQSIRHVLKSIKDEMMVLEILNHPNVVQYYGVEVHRDKVFIFMEYCQGGSLAGLLEYGRIEDEQVIQVYTLQMLEGLAYLHSCGVVHRDIKPENILLDHMGVVKFVDFGAAKVIARTGKTMRGATIGIGAKTKLNSMTGTPMYMSPEVITGQDPGRQGSIDIWSTGCCVLEMATGRRPWANLDNEWAIMYHIAAGHLPQLPSADQLSEDGRKFLLRTLERDPNKRPSAMELLNDPWILHIRNIVLGTVQGTDDSGGSSPSELQVESRPEPIAERQALERVIQSKEATDGSWESAMSMKVATTDLPKEHKPEVDQGPVIPLG